MIAEEERTEEQAGVQNGDARGPSTLENDSTPSKLGAVKSDRSVGASPSITPKVVSPLLGVGMQLVTNGSGQCVVSDLIQGGTAAASGELATGDVVCAIDGQQVSGKTAEVIQMVRGPEGSRVAISFFRPGDTTGETRMVTLARKRISLPSPQREFGSKKTREERSVEMSKGGSFREPSQPSGLDILQRDGVVGNSDLCTTESTTLEEQIDLQNYETAEGWSKEMLSLGYTEAEIQRMHAGNWDPLRSIA